MDNQINDEIIQVFSQKVVLTKDELLYKFSLDELKLLCSKFQCKVDMWKWNPVDDMREKLEKDGRFKNRTPQYCLRLLSKGVNKHKKRIMYDPKEIQEIREEDWNIQKKACIHFIREYKKKKKHDQNSNIVETEDENVISHNNSANSVEQNINENENEIMEEQLFDSVSNYTIGDTEILLESNELIRIGLAQSDVQNTVISSTNRNTPTQLNSQDFKNIEINSELCENLDYNTESMTLDTEEMANVRNIHINKEFRDFMCYNSDFMSTDTNTTTVTDVPVQSQNILTCGYSQFDREIPLTSTQSQN